MNYTHKLSGHPLYSKFTDMITRCENKKSDRYRCYGGRGIQVCKEWRNDFKKFYDWCVSNGYKDGLSIDRIDVNKGYSPDNCRIVDLKAQARNKQNTRIVEYNGESIGLAELCNRLGKSNRDFKTIYERIHTYKWTAQKALDTPIRRRVF